MTRGASFVLVGLMLTMGGCASLPTLQTTADVAVPPAFSFAVDATTARDVAALLPDDQGFRTLREAANDAPNIAVALARIDAARAAVRATGAAQLPEITATGGATRNRGSVASQPGNPFFIRDRSVFETRVDASWEIDLFGRLRADQRAASERLDAAIADADSVRLALETDIATAVVDYRDASARESVVSRDLADARELVRLTRIRATAGIVPEFDAVRAASLVSDAEARLAMFAGERADALGTLVTLTGRDGSFVLKALAQGSTMTLPPSLPVGLPSEILRNRPDVRAAAARLGASRDDVATAAALRFPRLTLTGALGLLSLAAGELFSGDALEASVGTGLMAPLLDFGRIGAQIDTRNAQAREAFAAYRASVFRAIGETESAIGRFTATGRRLAALEAQAGIDADALGLSRERYRLGLADFLTVIDAQRTLNSTRQNEERARGDLRRAGITLYKSVGARP